MAYGDFKDLPRRTTSGEILRGRAFSNPKIPKYNDYQRGLDSMVYKVFDKTLSGGGVKSVICMN